MIRKLLTYFNLSLPAFPSAPPAHKPAQETLYLLSGLIGIAAIAHFAIAKLEVAALAAGILLFKLALMRIGRSVPHKAIIILLTVTSFSAIVILYGGWNGQRAGISFLVVLVCLKFLESNNLRDYFVVCLILYFLAASSFLFNSSMPSIVAILFYTLAITGLMLKLSSPSPIDWTGSLGSAGSILVKALPLAILLFFFFPRIQGSFGFLPSQDKNAFDNELNNSLIAGEMAASAFNTALAFRVEFDGAIPAPNQLYWRSKVMPVEDNFRWSVDSNNPASNIPRDDLNQLQSQYSAQYQYRILHEDSSDLSLPYLDYVIKAERGKIRTDYSVWQKRKNSGSVYYQGQSLASPFLSSPSEEKIKQLLKTELQPTARTQALLNRWRQQSSSPRQRVDMVLAHFRDNDFRYSLTPPFLENTPVDRFLFETQVGYCEHYAAVFSTLMRWLDIPTRIVTGYQGGELNQSGEFFEVRYSDAHAWSEVLLDQQWVRVDPTATISPERIEFGMPALLSLWDGNALSYSGGGQRLANFLNPTGARYYMRLMRDNWKNMSYQWNKWVVNYDVDKQAQLLSNLGFDSRYRLSSLLAILFAGGGTLIAFYFWRLLPRKAPLLKEQQLYLTFVSRFKTKQLVKLPHESPNEFAARAKKEVPQLSEQIDQITLSYNKMRFGQQTSTNTLLEFKDMVKRFKLTH